MNPDPKYRQRFLQMADWIEQAERVTDEHPSYFNFKEWIKSAFRPDSATTTLNQVVEHPCGTMACIGGWAAIFQGIEDGFGDVEFNPSTFNRVLHIDDKFCALYSDPQGMKWLGLEDGEGPYLFMGAFSRRGLHETTANVVRKLRRVAETGLVREPTWDHEELGAQLR